MRNILEHSQLVHFLCSNWGIYTARGAKKKEEKLYAWSEACHCRIT
jgi:hypothetical protein